MLSPFVEVTVDLLDNVSVLCAYFSVSFWLFAQLPQVIKNHTDKSVEGLSLAFLLCWFSGDFLNLVSCLLNDAMMFQTLLSSYYCLIDLVLAAQYYYYKNMYHNPASKWYHRRHHHHHGNNSNNNHHHPHYRHTPTFTPTAPAMSPRASLRANLDNYYGSIDRKIDTTTAPAPAPRKVEGLFGRSGSTSTARSVAIAASTLVGRVSKAEAAPIASVPHNNSTLFELINFAHAATILFTANIGKLLAWSCTLLYLVSRFPQIYTNYKFKSTAGVSLKLVCFALCGNLFYSFSLLLCRNSTAGGEVSRAFWDAELSYFIGAIGTVASDIFVLCQWCLYDKNRVSTGRSNRLRPRSVGNTPSTTAAAAAVAATTTVANTNITASLPRTIAAAVPGNMSTPIEVAESIKSTLSPSHIKKLNESTPLSPIDFLLDTYVPQLEVQSNKQKLSHTPSRRSSVLREDVLGGNGISDNIYVIEQ